MIGCGKFLTHTTMDRTTATIQRIFGVGSMSYQGMLEFVNILHELIRRMAAASSGVLMTIDLMDDRLSRRVRESLEGDLEMSKRRAVASLVTMPVYLGVINDEARIIEIKDAFEADLAKIKID